MPVMRGCLTLCALLAVGGATQPSPTVGEHRLQVHVDSPPRIVVEAQIDVRDGLLVMATGGGIDHLPSQWATFVRNLRVTDSGGRVLQTEPTGADGWRIAGGHTGRVRLDYDVDLAFTTRPWPPGNEQAGIWREGSLYLVTRPLFVASTLEGIRHVTIAAPPDWRVSTPWEVGSGTSDTFVVQTRDELMENSLVLGSHAERRLDYGPFTITLALLGDLGREQNAIGSVLEGVGRHVNRVFPNTRGRVFL